MNDLVKSVSIALVALLLCFGCSKCNQMVGLEDDHPLEEASEQILEHIIKEKIGLDLDIDLTPLSPE